MSLVLINTICPIAHASRAREIAHAHMVEIEQASCSLEQMLPTLLSPVSGGSPTHVFCARRETERQLRLELETLSSQAESWIARRRYSQLDDRVEILSLFCCFTGHRAWWLKRLGLREVA